MADHPIRVSQDITADGDYVVRLEINVGLNGKEAARVLKDLVGARDQHRARMVNANIDDEGGI